MTSPKGRKKEEGYEKEIIKSYNVLVFILCSVESYAAWVTSTIDSTGSVGVGYYNDIAIDSNNKAHIVYNDDTNSDLKYATNATGSGTTYYWKVVADDGKGGTASSETRSYTTQ
jgi:hypothetical protein